MSVVFEIYSYHYKAAVLEMMAAFSHIDGYDFDIAIREQNLEEFTSSEALGKIYVIKVMEEVVGYIVLTFDFSFEHKGRNACIDELYVKPKHRKQGIGRAAINFLEEKASSYGVRAIHLEVELHNTNALALYRRGGYIEQQRRLMTKIIDK